MTTLRQDIDATVAALDEYGHALDCLDGHGRDGCHGPVEYRHPLTATGRAFPRCELHWERRLDEQVRIGRLYPYFPPPMWSAADAGECWTDDY